MKRIFLGMLGLLLAWSGWQVVRADNFDPTLPPEPMTKYAVTVSADPAAGASSLNGAGKYVQGTAITISQTTAENYQFEHWTLNGVLYATTASVTYTVGDSAAVFVAHYTYTLPPEPVVTQVGITVSADPVEGGTVTGGGVYTTGQYASISAVANSNYGYSFEYWKKDGAFYSSNSYISYLVGTEPAEFVAHFAYSEFDPTTPSEPIAKYRVYTSALPAAAATTTGDGSYGLGSSVNIKATAQSGYVFKHWTLNGYIYSTALSFNYTIGDSVAFFVAVFDRQQTVSVQANPNEGGIVTGSGMYIAGSSVTIGVSQQVPYVFDYWTLNGWRIEQPQSFSYTVGDSTATFMAIMRDTTDKTFNPETPPEPVIYTRITATAPENYYFVSWNDGNTDNPRMVPLSEKDNYTPIFAPVDFAINTSATICSNEYYMLGGQRLTLPGVYKATLRSSIGSDSVVTLNLSVNPSYMFTTVDTIYDGGSVVFIDTLLTSGGIYRKAFKTQNGCDSIYQRQIIHISDSATLSVLINPTHGGSVSGVGKYPKGTLVSVTATPATGWHFVRWYDGATDITRQESVTENKQIVAYFAINRYEVIFLDWDGSVLKKDSLNYGAAIVAPANPTREGYTFIGWDKDFSNITSDLTIAALYEQNAPEPEPEPEDNVVRDSLDLSVDGNTIDGWTIIDATMNASGTNESQKKYSYDIVASVPGTAYVTAKPNFQFQITNGSNKNNAFLIYPGRCYEFGGKNGIIHIAGTAKGDTIKIRVAAKGSTAGNFLDASGTYPKNATALTEDLTLPAKNSTGADANGYVWRTLKFLSNGGDVDLKETSGGFRINLIEKIHIKTSNPADIDHISYLDGKSRKFFRDGQIFILRGNKVYTITGLLVR